jgi:myo-inositol 2-dehydrogenase/D-chiro-inositol 1-dehydrogenase
MAKNLRFAVIGAGRIGLVHAGSVYDTKGAELVYIVDPIKEAADKIATEFDCKAAVDPVAVINSGEIDAVIIGSPTPTHVPLLSAAIDAGVHALCEKPIDLDIKNVDALREKANKAKSHVAIGFNRPLDPHFDSVRQKVRAGEIGDIEQLIITSRDPGPAPQAYIAVSGGIFRDMTIHDFDMARHFVKDIVEVYAVGTNVFCDYIKEENDYDNVNVVMKGSKGELITIIGSRHSAFGYDQRIEAFGPKGMLLTENVRASSVQLFSKDVTTSGIPYMDFFLERYAASYRNELKAFLKGIEEGKQYNSSYDDGRAALILADAALESSRTGKVVKVNLN